MSEKDWTEDFAHDNGCYLCRCHKCGEHFTGYKRRVTCKVCAFKERPRVVCLCGSTRFVEQFNEWRQKLTMQREIVLAIEIVTSQTREQDPQHSAPETKRMLDNLHLHKIDMADYVMVLNVGGYVGESTAKEVHHAAMRKKPIVWLEPNRKCRRCEAIFDPSDDHQLVCHDCIFEIIMSPDEPTTP